MNNRYICKGKTTYDKWVDGDLITFGGRCYIHPQNSDFEVKSGLARIVRVYKVIPETVGQCTGLKDKNGKLIFEGDVVKITDFQVGLVTQECGAFGVSIVPRIDWDYLDSEIAEITGCDNMPHFCRNDNFISLWELMWNYNQEDFCSVVEVIGDIHDNPELVKGGDTE